MNYNILCMPLQQQTYSGKALLIPINTRGEILIQDRRGHKEPEWGFFGGSIETGETPLQAVIREAKEELDLDILPNELTSIGEIDTRYNGDMVQRYFFLYPTDQETFIDFEGKGAHWMSFEDAGNIMDKAERLNILEKKFSELDV